MSVSTANVLSYQRLVRKGNTDFYVGYFLRSNTNFMTDSRAKEEIY